ncbi:hypothetical protein PR003_g27842 [Phytophthora rubi]|uniref:Secreted protein n=1 Tax=Phytophthora rubi TaxID=129364 RepID=A0A6A4BWM8_9STRA|nr:hypothetical protein PR003_g27842 [Phytophthora rubi]
MPCISGSTLALFMKVTMHLAGWTRSPDSSPNFSTICSTRVSWLTSCITTVESSTKAENLCLTPWPPDTLTLVKWLSCRIAIASTSTVSRKSNGARGPPCLIPDTTTCGSESSPLTRNLTVVPSCSFWINRTNYNENPKRLSAKKRKPRATVSYAFLKSSRTTT